MQELPKTPAEVISRLDSVVHPRPALEVAFAAPRDVIEQKVATIWSEVLRFEELGVNDDFFELGGDSIQMIRIISRLRASYEVEVSLGEFFENPTPARLAEVVRSRGIFTNEVH